MTQASLRASRIIAAMRPKTPALPCQGAPSRGFHSDDASGIFTLGIVLGVLLAGTLLIVRTVRATDAS